MKTATGLRLVALFFLGLVTGASVTNLITGRHLEKAYLEIQSLQDKVADQERQIESLQAELDLRQESLVKEIKIHVLHDEKYIRLEIEDFAKGMLQELVGKEVENIDPILVSNILDNRVTEIDKTAYTLRVKAVLVSERILVYIVPDDDIKAGQYP
ncbi:hypothetical protein Tfer_3173 [Thermincola ferriacetica]|uniref:Sporulation membrane protein YtrI C-terminal domain-containing protein n=1 Tax=Thermincola ferriacetica TaxID=281456 RepID=A0A0L6VYE4_9FIRM|nr:hypothetical protein [Thermincola ferriacetica]KNZ68275.1 hypothetical protein Tfer_3173 [Thermincola ferriacetica]